MFIHYLNDADSQRQFVDAANFLPTRADLVEEGIDYGTRPEDMAVRLADITRTPESVYTSAYSPEFAPAATEFVDVFAEVVSGQRELAAAMEELAASLDG